MPPPIVLQGADDEDDYDSDGDFLLQGDSDDEGDKGKLPDVTEYLDAYVPRPSKRHGRKASAGVSLFSEYGDVVTSANRMVPKSSPQKNKSKVRTGPKATKVKSKSPKKADKKEKGKKGKKVKPEKSEEKPATKSRSGRGTSKRSYAEASSDEENQSENESEKEEEVKAPPKKRKVVVEKATPKAKKAGSKKKGKSKGRKG